MTFSLRWLVFRTELRRTYETASNAETAVGVDDIGRHLLDASLPLAKPPAQHKEVKVDPKLFGGYVGTLRAGSVPHNSGADNTFVIGSAY